MCINPKIKILFFASCRDAVGHRSCDWEIAEGYRVADLQRELVAAYPQLAAAQQVLSIAVNGRVRREAYRVKSGRRGGSYSACKVGADVFKITEDPIKPDDLFAGVVRDENGAVATFAGVVRNHSGDQQTDYLVYEAYPGYG